MARFPYSRPSCVLRRGVFGLVLALPILAGTADSKRTDGLDSSRNDLLKKQSFDLAQSVNLNENVEVETGQEKPAQVRDQSKEKVDQPSEQTRVLISEVIIEGLDGHPEKERLEFAAYDAMKIRPGSRVIKDELKIDLNSIYATGWFSGVRVEPINGSLGVQLLVNVQPNPLLTKVQIEPKNSLLTDEVLRETFRADFGRTLNLNILQLRLKSLRKWYLDQGYSLARISGPNRVTPGGIVQLSVIEGAVAGVEIKFLNKEGEPNDEKGQLISGKTRPWVIKREISVQPGDPFNRNQLESDIKRLYATSLFSDVKVTLQPVAGQPGNVTIVLGITEQSTGSLSGGIGFSQSQGVFGQIGLDETNLIGRSWKSSLKLTYGQYGGLVNFSLTDPWLKGDKHRTSFRSSFFLSREIPQEFRSQSGGSFRTASDYHDGGTYHAYNINSTKHSNGTFASVAAAKADSPTKSWFDYEGDSVALERAGAGFVFSRPLNGGNPYKKVPWSVALGVNFQRVRPIDYAANSRPYGVSTNTLRNGQAVDDDVICVAFNCATENNLVGVRAATTYNNLNDSRNPTSGDFASLATEQYISVGEDSPTFNRVKAGYSHFFPVNWLRISKGCRPKSGENLNCPQAVGVLFKAGTVVGELPPYEAFCLGGSSSVRGWTSCDLGVGRSFGEATVEYRFPIWGIVSGAFFVDAASSLGTQGLVPGKPGQLLEKPGGGFSPGTGVIINTPVGPIRIEAANQNLDGEMRFNLGVGWKF